MPILFIDSSNDPELETWIGDLLKAAAKSVSPAGAILDDDAIRKVLAKEIPELLEMADRVEQKFKKKRLLAEIGSAREIAFG